MTDSFYKYWGKAGEGDDFHLLVYHSLDVAGVGKIYCLKNESFTKFMSERLKLSEEGFIQIFCFFLSLHDLGKFSESFQNLRSTIREMWWEKSHKEYIERHDTLGWWIWKALLEKRIVEKLGLAGPDDECLTKWFSIWAKIVVGHHGSPTDRVASNGKYLRHLKKFAGNADYLSIQTWFDVVFELFGVESIIKNSYSSWGNDEKQIDDFKKASWELEGVVILCDWLGSNSDVFTYVKDEISISDYWENCLKKADHYISNLNVLPSPVNKNLNFETLFPDFANSGTPLQNKLNSIDLKPIPQCWILEDVTGAGKTEAALILAGRLISMGLGEGIFIGLPTMATTNGMFERMLECYQRFYSVPQKASITLAHGAKHLSESFGRVLEAGKKIEEGYSENITAQCADWFADSSKKSLLADVGVGTIDQALLSILPIKHQSLRKLGLARKILIVDEIHAYDVYMQQLLKKLLRSHAQSGGSAILLSATLTKKMRENLLSSYFEEQSEIDEPLELEKDEYPLVSAIGVQGEEAFAVEEAVETREEVKRTVKVELQSSIESVIKIVEDHIAEGHCVCWVRNTVGEAMEAYGLGQKIKGLKNDHLHLFHSRFCMGDRIEIESEVLNYFGKNSDHAKRNGRLLIATQVVEQSLDLDFDVMISDLAPIDLLIQRAGRLQRHKRDPHGNRSNDSKETIKRIPAVLHVYGPEPNIEPYSNWYKDVFKGASYVYTNVQQLWDTHQILKEKGKIQMPEMAREMIEGVYGDKVCLEVFERQVLEFEGGKSLENARGVTASLKLNYGYSIESSDLWIEEEQAKTRLGEEQQTVFLAVIKDQKVRPFFDGKFAWDLSSLKIRSGQIEQICVCEEEQKIIDEVRSQNRRVRANDLIIPLIESERVWKARGIKGNQSLEVIYDKKLGFRIEKV